MYIDENVVNHGTEAQAQTNETQQDQQSQSQPVPLSEQPTVPFSNSLNDLDTDMRQAAEIPLPDDDDEDILLEVPSNAQQQPATGALDTQNQDQQMETSPPPPTTQPTSSEQTSSVASSTEEGAIGGATSTIPQEGESSQQPVVAPVPSDAFVSPLGDEPVSSQSEPSSSQNQDMDPAIRAILGDLEVPEGIDPSFLAALPSEMRDEVIAEHLRQQRIRQRAAAPPPVASDAPPVAEVNPEFLAALPPNIQEEVLAQQRLEQQRQAAVNMNPNDPVDAAAFFQNLTPQLRQAVSGNVFHPLIFFHTKKNIWPPLPPKNSFFRFLYLRNVI